MKIKSKGKIYPSPSPSSSSSSSSSSYRDAMSVLKLLPAAILSLALLLPIHDREVLAYLITRSITTTTTTTTTTVIEHQKRKCKRPISSAAAAINVQKHPIFECGCFECYTRFWVRWDSSPNRELIHQAIEAFEDHLTNIEFPKRNFRARKRDKLVGRREIEVFADVLEKQPEVMAVTPVSDVIDDVDEFEDAAEEDVCGEDEKLIDEVASGNMEMAVTVIQSPASYHKGLARKVLPDVVGILNSRLWSLWSPNI